MNAADRRRLTPVLGIVAVLLLLVLIALWLGWGRGAHWRDDAAPPKLPPPGASLPPPAVPPLERYAEVWQRPLFSPTRTPEPVANGDGAAGGDLELTGVIMLPGLKMAILHDKASNRDYRVVEGRPSGDGPALIDLQPRSAVVEASGSRVQLQLIPGASSDAGGAQGPDSAAQAASAMVTRRVARAAGQPSDGNAGERARQLKARSEAERRRVAQHDDGG